MTQEINKENIEKKLEYLSSFFKGITAITFTLMGFILTAIIFLLALQNNTNLSASFSLMINLIFGLVFTVILAIKSLNDSYSIYKIQTSDLSLKTIKNEFIRLNKELKRTIRFLYYAMFLFSFFYITIIIFIILVS